MNWAFRFGVFSQLPPLLARIRRPVFEWGYHLLGICQGQALGILVWTCVVFPSLPSVNSYLTAEDPEA